MTHAKHMGWVKKVVVFADGRMGIIYGWAFGIWQDTNKVWVRWLDDELNSHQLTDDRVENVSDLRQVSEDEAAMLGMSQLHRAEPVWR